MTMTSPRDPHPAKKQTRIQRRNRMRILDAALDVFSRDGYRGATLDQIAETAGLSKPNILYYFNGKEEIHVTLILQGAPRMSPHLASDLRPLFEEKCALIQSWVDAGKLANVDPAHLIFSIWSTTQHYADFEVQIAVLTDGTSHETAQKHLQTMFKKLLTPA